MKKLSVATSFLVENNFAGADALKYEVSIAKIDECDCDAILEDKYDCDSDEFFDGGCSNRVIKEILLEAKERNMPIKFEDGMPWWRVVA